MNVNSSTVCRALKLRYPVQSHALMFEVAPSTGGGTRYADAVAVGLWNSHGHKVEGIEVKVSRSDFLSEMRQPEKSAPVFKFCDHWWLACPKDMVKPDEIPSTWGLLELLDSGILKVKVRAPKLDPSPITLGFFAAMARRHAGMDEQMTKDTIDIEVAARVKAIKAQMEREFQQRTDRRLEKVEEALAVLSKIKDECGLDLSELSYRNHDFVNAVKLVHSMNGKYGPISDVRRTCSQLLQVIDGSNLLDGSKA